MSKTSIKRSTIINAPKDKVWAALADFGGVQNMSPNVAKSYLTSDQKEGVGATRHCDFVAMGAQVEERITAWEEGQSMEIHIYETKKLPAMTDIYATFQIEEKDGGTLLQATLEYDVKSFFGNVMNSLALKKGNEKSWNQFVAGIKLNVETGTIVGKDTKLDLSVVEA